MARLRASLLSLLVSIAFPAIAAAQPVGTAFTYQGRLTDGGVPANGTHDFRFVLYDAALGGGQVGPIVTRDDVAVTEGLFMVALDFGAVFKGSRHWLEVAVRPGASTGAYTPLTSRQELTPTPYAVFSAAAPWSGLSGVPAGFADGIDNNSGGDVTGVTAGVGLTGGGATGNVTLAVDFTGTGTATTAARSDHLHFGQSWSGARPGPGLQLTNSGTGPGLFGQATHATAATEGVRGESASSLGSGVAGYATSSTGFSVGVFGRADSTDGTAVEARATSISGYGTGVLAWSSSADGVGVDARALSNSVGATGVGIYAASESPEGDALVAQARGGYAVFATTLGSDNVAGVSGVALATSGDTKGVHGASGSTTGAGVVGEAYATSGSTHGVLGRTWSPVGRGVEGIAIGTSGVNYGVYGTNFSAAGYAGYFQGRAHVTGTLSKGAGSFKIDHPLDPENKYLYHSFVESPDMMNVYNGNVILDERGEAEIVLPTWFEALNRDYRYQLTPIGAPGPGVHVAQEIEEDRFRIGGGSPGLKVSWQVTGIRKDAFAEAHRIPVEEEKPAEERGKYLHPSEHGADKERGLDYRPEPVRPEGGPERLAAARRRRPLRGW